MSDPNPEKSTILVIDDDRDVRTFLERFLRINGFQVLLAEGGEEGLMHLTQHPEVELLILDLMMPGMSGYEVMEQLAQQEQNTPVMIISAKSEQDEVRKAIELGAVDYLFKPFNKDYLLFKLNNILERQRDRARQAAARRKSVHLQAATSLMIRRITTQGITFESTFPVDVGAVVVISSTEINQRADLPRDYRFSCRVTASGGGGNKYRTDADYISLSPEVERRIKAICEESGWNR